MFNKPAFIAQIDASEQITPGAFRRSLASGQEVLFLYAHDPNMSLARLSAGTLQLSETSQGLEFTAQLPDTSYARDLIENIKAGNVQGCSFGFDVCADYWDSNGVRTLTDVNLKEITATPIPAYAGTSLSARSAGLGKSGFLQRTRSITPQERLAEFLAEDALRRHRLGL